MKSLALQTLSSLASAFLVRYLRDHPQSDWSNAKAALKGRFSDLADTQFAAQQLRRLKQKSSENVQAFAERIYSLAEEAYPGQDLSNAVLQKQLTELFIDGVSEDTIVRKLIRERPATLEAAIRTAAYEQQTSKTFNLRRHRYDEPWRLML